MHEFFTFIESMSMSPERRRSRLIALLERMNAGKDVAPRDLKNALLPAEYEDLQMSWSSQKELRDDINDKPNAVQEYEELLRRALFLNNKSEGYSNNPKKSQLCDKSGVRYARKFHDQSQAAFERALEHLQESVQIDQSLHIWFDRPLVFGLDGNIDLSPEGMPKAVTSRSVDRKGMGILHSVQRKRQLKQDALERALEALKEQPEDANAGVDAQRVRDFLQHRR